MKKKLRNIFMAIMLTIMIYLTGLTIYEYNYDYTKIDIPPLADEAAPTIDESKEPIKENYNPTAYYILFAVEGLSITGIIIYLVLSNKKRNKK